LPKPSPTTWPKLRSADEQTRRFRFGPDSIRAGSGLLLTSFSSHPAVFFFHIPRERTYVTYGCGAETVTHRPSKGDEPGWGAGVVSQRDRLRYVRFQVVGDEFRQARLHEQRRTDS